jgi:hypothetical protein
MFSQKPRSKFNLAAELRPLVPQADNSWQSESPINQFGDLGYSLSPGIKEGGVGYRRRDRKGFNIAVLGVLFSLASLACLWVWLLTHLVLWMYGSAAAGYAGVHLSLFGKGPARIVGVVLNVAVLVGCIVSAILFKGLIRIELGW